LRFWMSVFLRESICGKFTHRHAKAEEKDWI
jgi:hypothetical protein